VPPTAITRPSSLHRTSLAEAPFSGGPAAHVRVGRLRFTERNILPVRNPLPRGTNGYTSSWGTNAHGELSSCPPGRS
jgi:hypothetical protein